MNIVSLIIHAVGGATLRLSSNGVTIRGVPVSSRVPVYVLLFALIAATGSMARGDWTQYRFDAAHHGLNPNEPILSAQALVRSQSSGAPASAAPASRRRAWLTVWSMWSGIPDPSRAASSMR